MATPNYYQLRGNKISVVYRTFEQGPPHGGQDSPPFVTYEDPTRSVSFSGDQVQVVDTEAGQIVSVVLDREASIFGAVTTVISSTTFSFLIPQIVVVDHSARMKTVGITTVYQSADSGQVDAYKTVVLRGTATASDIIAKAAVSA